MPRSADRRPSTIWIAGPPLAGLAGQVEGLAELAGAAGDLLQLHERGERAFLVQHVGPVGGRLRRGRDDRLVLGRGLVAEAGRLRPLAGGLGVGRPLHEDVAGDDVLLRPLAAVDRDRLAEQRLGLGVAAGGGENFCAKNLRVAAAERVAELVVQVGQGGENPQGGRRVAAEGEGLGPRLVGDDAEDFSFDRSATFRTASAFSSRSFHRCGRVGSFRHSATAARPR